MPSSIKQITRCYVLRDAGTTVTRVEKFKYIISLAKVTRQQKEVRGRRAEQNFNKEGTQ